MKLISKLSCPIKLLFCCAILNTATIANAIAQEKAAPVKTADGATLVDNTDLYNLFEMMSGKFSSEAQSKADTSYFNISLKMHPIWQSRTDGHWFYVEQAMATKLDKPYRQRVYHLYLYNDKKIASSVFEIPNPAAYVGSCEKDNPLSNLTPDSLISREGCTIFLEKMNTEVFSGSTPQKQCKSSLRGAAYATSEVTITSGLIISWDRGWDDKDKQVWGAEKGGYEFDKLEDY
ncbi:MAG TPA: chromophore lyase CpcT/CpeT [Bacteroidia bacterium]|nr:chromophore lyase CpcT/CpeT [Bacteroidia bacterium]